MKKDLFLKIFLFLTVVITFTSCVDQRKYVYFQKSAGQSDTINVAKPYIPKIEPGDILAIPVTSLNPIASSFFNPYSSGANSQDDGAIASSATSASLSQTTTNGFLVDANGNIEIPLLGSVKVAGLTTSEARDTIRNKLKFYTKEPTVNVRFLNYKISVMGEVVHPGVYIISNERVTLPEAISMAGDLTIYAKHDNIMVIRDLDGKKVFGHLNLNSRDIFTSPYYYLHSGDIVYVEQTKTKVTQADPTIRILPVILSSIAALALILYRFK